MAVRLQDWLHLKAYDGIRSAALMLTSPPMDSLATIELFCRSLCMPRVRILQQASVMLGHCRMRSLSKPQSHAR